MRTTSPSSPLATPFTPCRLRRRALAALTTSALAFAVACGDGAGDQGFVTFPSAPQGAASPEAASQPKGQEAYASGSPASTTPTTATTDGGAPTATPSFSLHTWQPPGKGMWIWTFDYVGLTPAQAAQRAKDLGVAYVLIKSGQDAKFWPTRFNATIVNEFRSRGIRVLAWPYITPNNITGSIAAAAEAARVVGCDGLVLDVEVEWESGGLTTNSAKAQQLCQGIRTAVPGVWLGYTSFGWVGYHTAFPFKAFDDHCGDAAFPQVYFSDRGVSWNGPSGLSQAVAQYKAANLKAPMWPITSNDDVHGTTAGPTTTALNGFFAAAGPFTSLWTLPDKARPEKHTQLDQLDWLNP